MTADQSQLFPGPEPAATMTRAATVSPDGRYRYELTRRWDLSVGVVLWIMLNPSTADGDVDDPTIRRCIAFSRREGFGALKVVNLYAYRATNPLDLIAESMAGRDVCGPDNHSTLWSAISSPTVGLVVAAWGSHIDAVTPPTYDVEKMAERARRRLVCLGRTKSGAPRHPLYVKGDKPLETWWAAR